MNRSLHIWFRFVLPGLILGGTGCGACELRAQGGDDRGLAAQAMHVTEQVTLFTDRNMYAVDEPIRFRAFYRINGLPAGEPLSRVLYVELVTPAGMAVAGAKYPIGENGSSGCLEVPSDARTGNYYLRAYTRWMRNFGPRSYSYVPLTIINPYSREVVNGGNGSRPGNGHSERGDGEEGPGAPASRSGETGKVRRVITCSTEKAAYLPGETVSIKLAVRPGTDLSPGSCCVTVVPVNLADTLQAGIHLGSAPVQDPGSIRHAASGYAPAAPSAVVLSDASGSVSGEEFNCTFLPEIRGISISGNVTAAGTGPVRLHFSLLGEDPDYFGTLTDEKGRFIVSLPERTGTRELFVAAERTTSETGQELSIRIDQDFATDPLPFPVDPFGLSPERRDAAGRMVMNMQLSEAFRPDRPGPAGATDTAGDSGLAGGTGPAGETGPGVPFYGNPVVTVPMEDFVSLPTMTEVFENLVPSVYVKYNRGEAYLKIESRNSMISHLPPLILLDGIPVFDQKAVLAVDPSKILKIDLINEVFVRGSMYYGGILAITSKEGDMASVELPGGGYFFDYQVFHPECRHDSRPANGRVPDSRNTLLWNDDISLGPDDAVDIRFTAASAPGEYIILVRGLSPRSEIICGTGRFRVARERKNYH